MDGQKRLENIRKKKNYTSNAAMVADGMITESVPVNFEGTTQLYESNVPLPLASSSSSHL